jgi:hypothetical protein
MPNSKLSKKEKAYFGLAVSWTELRLNRRQPEFGLVGLGANHRLTR